VLPAGFEFHGVELWHQNNWWSELRPSEVIEVYRAVLTLLERHVISIAYATIHKANLQSRYAVPDSPYLLALQFLCQKINSVERDSLKVLVADESKEHEMTAVELVSDLQTWGSGVVPGRQLETIIDSLHYVRSEVSPDVQMADLVGFIIQRFRRHCDTHPDSVAALSEFRETIKVARTTYREVWPAR
jgi:hypothetical protein